MSLRWKIGNASIRNRRNIENIYIWYVRFVCVFFLLWLNLASELEWLMLKSGTPHTYMPDSRSVRRRGPLSMVSGIHLRRRWQPWDREWCLCCGWHSFGRFSPSAWSPVAYRFRSSHFSRDSSWSCGTPISCIWILEKHSKKSPYELGLSRMGTQFAAKMFEYKENSTNKR